MSGELTDAEREALAATWHDEGGSVLWLSLQNKVADLLAAARNDERERIKTVLIENRRATTNQAWLWDRVYDAIQKPSSDEVSA